MENISNEFATLQGFMGHWYDVIVTAIKGVAGAIAASVVGKGIGALAGSAAGGTGTGILAGAGGIALGTIAGVAAVGAIATAVAQGIADDRASAASNNASSYSDKYTTGQGDSLSAGNISSYAEQYGRSPDQNPFFSGKFWSNVIGGISNSFNFNGYNEDDPVGYNKEKWERVWGSRASKYDDETMEWVTAVYAMSIMDAGNDASVIPSVFGTNITAEGIKAFMHEKYKDKQTAADSAKKYELAARILASEGLYAIGPNGQFTDLSWTQSDLENWGMFRQGLDEVPYDDYPAILHEGEAVLTASTANELRNLIDEYRTTTNQSINFETIIQNQTASLINKLEQIRQTMEGTYTKESTSVNESNGAASKLNFQSMINMRNTKSAFDK